MFPKHLTFSLRGLGVALIAAAVLAISMPAAAVDFHAKWIDNGGRWQVALTYPSSVEAQLGVLQLDGEITVTGAVLANLRHQKVGRPVVVFILTPNTRGGNATITKIGTLFEVKPPVAADPGVPAITLMNGMNFPAAPATPMVFSVQAMGTDSLKVQWIESADATAHYIHYRPTPKPTDTVPAEFMSVMADPMKSTSGQDIMGLTAATSYDVKVVAKKTSSLVRLTLMSSSESAVKAAMTAAAPAAPMGVMVTPMGSDLMVKWTNSTTAGAMHYIHYGVTGTAAAPTVFMPYMNDAMDLTSMAATGVTLTGLTAATSYDVKVIAKDANGMMTPSASAPPYAMGTTAAAPAVPATLAAGKYIVVVRDNASPPFGILAPTVVKWSQVSDEAEMPDLQRLFDVGGSLNVKVTGATRLQVIFSEVMWAVDEGEVDDRAKYLGEQWIELHNRTSGDGAKNFALSDIKISSQERRPALPEETDRISTVVGGGEDWVLNKGQNGNSGAPDGTGRVEFISMFRNNYGEHGYQSSRWSVSTELYATNHRGTPGQKERAGIQIIGKSGVALGTVINEIANYPSANSRYEWIELRKREGELGNLENWVVDMVTGVNTQKRLFTLTKRDAGRYGDILLLTKTDPATDESHPLRGGYDITKSDDQQVYEGRDKNIRYYVVPGWDTDLPDNGEFVLILRHNKDRSNHERVEDIAGYHPNLKVDSANAFTNLWPLRGYPAPASNKNAIVAGAVHGRQHDRVDGTGTIHGAKRDDQVALRDHGWTGIGYKRNTPPSAQHGGTPGYPNNALLSNETQAGADPVVISEIMYSTGDRGNLPQWIELRNTSQTAGVNLHEWRLTIVNHDQNSADPMDTYPHALVKHYGLTGTIPPGQTYLIASHSSTDNTNLPKDRIKVLGNRRGDLIMSQYGFEITLLSRGKGGNDANRKVADKVGNLAAETGTRVRNTPQSYADPTWMLPAGINEDGDRISIVRVSMMQGPSSPVDGQTKAGWKSFDMSAHVNAPESTYYGNRNDFSSPGYTVDSVLPVSLSKFRPERLDDGSIRIVWSTESETNNAGFNILRSESKDGVFTKLNAQLIKGQGTTSERTTYTHMDTSAKPNVVYYYQIQDVSLDGNVTTLRTTHLRGNVSAGGKLTTTWGELKAQD